MKSFVYLNGFHGDCCETIPVGVYVLVTNTCLTPIRVSPQANELIIVNKECLKKAIAVCGPGVPFRSIGKAVE